MVEHEDRAVTRSLSLGVVALFHPPSRSSWLIGCRRGIPRGSQVGSEMHEFHLPFRPEKTPLLWAKQAALKTTAS